MTELTELPRVTALKAIKRGIVIMSTYPLRHLSIGIDRPYPQVYAFLADPANFPQWAAGLGQGVEHLGGTDWQVQTPSGPMLGHFTSPNPYGVLDHTLVTPQGEAFNNPMRLIANGTGVEVLFTLFQHPGTTAEAFATNANAVTRDLTKLKTLLEQTEAPLITRRHQA